MSYSISRLILLLLLTVSLTTHSTEKVVNLSLKQKPLLQLPTIYHKPKVVSTEWIQHFWVSEKLDGIRGYWTGTKLLTKQGNLIKTPANFTKGWPNTPLDGELWINRGEFEQVSTIVNTKVPDKNLWQKIRFMIFDLPKHEGSFTQRIQAMKRIIKQTKSPNLAMIEQIKVTSLPMLDTLLNQITQLNGEGLMLHHEKALYNVGRSKHLMKLKKHNDAEAIVIAYIEGKGKYQKKLGSLLVKTPEGLTFKIGSGFTDKQRINPPKIGSTITFKYYGKTNRGVPKFASFIRVRKTGI